MDQPPTYRSVHFDEQQGGYLEATVTEARPSGLSQSLYDLSIPGDCHAFGSLLLIVALELLGPRQAAHLVTTRDFGLSIVPSDPD